MTDNWKSTLQSDWLVALCRFLLSLPMVTATRLQVFFDKVI